MRVDDLADARAGDKGGTLILAVLPRGDAQWQVLREHLTAELVARHFGPLAAGPVTRSEVPGLPALVFRLPGVLGGGVTASTALDGHGKTLSYHLLTLELPVPLSCGRASAGTGRDQAGGFGEEPGQFPVRGGFGQLGGEGRSLSGGQVAEQRGGEDHHRLAAWKLAQQSSPFLSPIRSPWSATTRTYRPAQRRISAVG